MELKNTEIPREDFLKAINSILTNLFLIKTLENTESNLRNAVGDNLSRDGRLMEYIKVVKKCSNVISEANKTLLECKPMVLQLVEYEDMEEANLFMDEEDFNRIGVFVGSTILISDTIKFLQKESRIIELYIKFRY